MVQIMAIGRSGRIVLEVDPVLKKKLYSLLAMESISLKEWFITKAQEKIAADANKIEKVK